MLKSLYVDGFKSLNGFELDFLQGLNVLIGPNGAGKTNICSVFNLLSSFLANRFSSYIVSQGGSAALVSKCSDTQDGRIVVRVVADLEVGGPAIRKKKKYEYEYELTIQFRKDDVTFLEEYRLFRTLLRGAKKLILEGEKSESSIKIKIHDKRNVGPISLKVLKNSRDSDIEIPIETGRSQGLNGLLSNFFLYCYLGFQDLKKAAILNIEPRIARASSDVVESNTMKFNGANLPNALDHLKTNRKAKYEEMLDLLKRIITDLDDINVISSEHEYRKYLQVTFNGVTCSSANLSDGTIKTIALLCGVLTSQCQIVIIEELENFLHPWACSLLVNYLRDSNKSSVFLLTTHSESVLNSCRPSELIVVNKVNQNTTYQRIIGNDKLVKAIVKSGMGCGYHYNVGNLGGTPQ